MDGFNHVLVGNKAVGFAVVDKDGGVWSPIYHQTGCLPIAIIVSAFTANGMSAFANFNGADHIDIRALTKYPNQDELGFWRHRTLEMQKLAEPMFRAQGVEVVFGMEESR
jgi:hypothetical protein